MKPCNFSIIICTYNRGKYIYDLLRSIAENDYPNDSYEIVFIDNNSTDQTKEECERFCKDFEGAPFRYIVEHNQGLSYARNRGIRESAGEYLIFIDDDAIVRHDYLKNLKAYLEEDPAIEVFGGEIIPKYESGEKPKWLSKWSYSWLSAIDKGEEKCLFNNKEYPIGANMGLKKALADQVGLFNTQLGRTKRNLIGGEEKDFFFRIRETGTPIYYLPKLSIQHCIPPERTTHDYIARLGLGIGKSERTRTQAEGRASYMKRCAAEIIKWAGTLVLWGLFLVKAQKEKGDVLCLFRKNVSQGLFLKS